jgi:hypothetical protein
MRQRTIGHNLLSPDRANLPSADQVKGHVQHAARETKPWVVHLGRLGHASIGVVYATVGILAGQAALGQGGGTTDTRGALQWLDQAPFGRLLLGGMAVGIAGYALWRFVQAALDTENKGSEVKGLCMRCNYVLIGLVYAGLALSALQLSLGSAEGGSSDASTQDGTARLLAQPFGQWLVAAAGAAVIGVGLYQFYLAYSGKFCDQLRRSELSLSQDMWMMRAGRLGFAARGVVFSIIGWLLVVAAKQAEPQQARGLGGALATLAQQPFGPLLLGIVALGLLAYGLYMLVEARFRWMVV